MGIDSPRGGRDRPAEDRPDRRPDNPVDRRLWARDITDPPTPAEVETERLRYRGELRWNGDRYETSEPYDWARRDDLKNRILKEVELPERTRELPAAGDVLPSAFAEIDRRKLTSYSLNAEHPQNGGKAAGWATLGFQIDTPDKREDAAEDIIGMTRVLLPHGKVDQVKETPFGNTYKVLNGYIGPNGQHGTLVSCWMIDGQGDQARPRMTTTWMQPHKDRGDQQ